MEFWKSAIVALFASLNLVLTFVVPTLAQSKGPYIGVDGWTVITPSPDTRTIYVSNSTGNDRFDGRAESRAVKTIARGLSLLRSGYPDWLLLKKGDTWVNEAFGWLCVSGRSAVEPILISSYGSGARPLLKTNFDAGIGVFGGGCTVGKGDFLALVGIEFYAYTRDPGSPAFDKTMDQLGTRFINPVTWILIEDCKFGFYTANINFDASSTGDKSILSIRRNILVGAYAKGRSVGMYVSGIANVSVEENFFEHNGWNEKVRGAEANIYSRNVYLQPNVGKFVYKGNISVHSSSEGAQLRAGGTITDNLFVRNPIGFDVGHSLSDGLPTTTSASVTNNVVLEATDISPLLPRRVGISVQNSKGAGVQINNNIISHAADRGGGTGIILQKDTSGVTVANNIIHKMGKIVDYGKANITSPNAINQTGYSDPDRTVASYDATLGGPGTLENFLARARMQSKENWNPQLTAYSVNKYIREGFGLQ